MTTLCLKLSDLEEEYQGKAYEEQVMIANIGAVCYRGLGELMREQLQKELTFSDKVKQEVLRATLEKEVMRPLQDKNKDLLESRMKCELLEKQIDLLKKQISISQEDIDKEIHRRVQYEYAIQLSELNKEVALLKVADQYHRKREGYINDLEETKATLYARIQHLEDKLQTETIKNIKENTKSSHEIGKQGEAMVLEMLETTVKKEFPYVEVTDMSHVPHSADFHLSLMRSDGKRVKILIDSKKYKRSVQNGDIEKLKYDIDKDEDATAGLMISLDSGICKKDQFQIEKTPHSKSIMYVTFEDMDDDLRREMLCLAIRIITTIGADYTNMEKNMMMDKISSFTKNMMKTAKNMHSCALQCKSLNDLIRDIRDELMSDIKQFRAETNSIDDDTDGGDGIEHISTEPHGVGRCKGTKPDGSQCRFRHIENGLYCKKHTGKIEADTV